ncbi:MAG: ornithine cyclodeaminase family protein, partial [Pseudomonadota bacterium]
GLITGADITPIGQVINGAAPGRRSDAEITVFDGTGVGLQDLAVAQVATELAEKSGDALVVTL